ncbi:neurogenin-1-like [Montipora capricornis]|uniref:neurogenin-1-like n=1 Tax=Montipora capricornis TaxID=246305 RepID=UPI0035F21738
MDDIFSGGFYTDALFNEDFMDDSFGLQNRPIQTTFAEPPMSSFVKIRESDFPTTSSTMQPCQLTTYSCAEKASRDCTTPKVMQSADGLKTTAAMKDVEDLCLAGNIMNDTWNPNVAYSASHSGQTRGQPLKKMRRLRANDRERRRMRSLNRALESLKKCLPVPQSKRRVTKLEILRIACNYIRSLSDTLSEDSRSSDGPARGKKSRSRGIVSDPVVNGFSVAQRLEILSGNNANRI